mgnify:CR=1 FL=1
MFNLGVLVCKVVSKISKLFGHEGSVIGGSYAFKIDKDILKKVKYPKYIIGVTGSSGKGSTTELVARILKENNYKAINFYHKYNFVEVAKRKGYYNGIDAILMELILDKKN